MRVASRAQILHVRRYSSVGIYCLDGVGAKCYGIVVVVTRRPRLRLVCCLRRLRSVGSARLATAPLFILYVLIATRGIGRGNAVYWANFVVLALRGRAIEYHTTKIRQHRPVDKLAKNLRRF